MDTERIITRKDQFPEFSYTELSSEELSEANYHVEITRHLQEIHYLFLMFQYGLDCIGDKYVLMSDGKVLSNRKPAVSVEDYIAINAMVNNLISAGRTLVESMECYVKENYPEGNENRERYMKFYHDTYDSSFSYRFLIRMRDYSQHGHLPVNQNTSWYGFDLYQVLNKPHYRHNAQIKQQLENAVKEIQDIYGDIPRLSLAMTLAEFASCLLSIYYQFWVSVEATLTASEERFKNLIGKHPENINVVGEENVSLFIYDVSKDGVAHVVTTGDDTCEMLGSFKSEAKAAADFYMNSWNELKRGTLVLSVVDKKRIEIGTLQDHCS